MIFRALFYFGMDESNDLLTCSAVRNYWRIMVLSSTLRDSVNLYQVYLVGELE